VQPEQTLSRLDGDELICPSADGHFGPFRLVDGAYDHGKC